MSAPDSFEAILARAEGMIGNLMQQVAEREGALRELVELKRLHDSIVAAEADGGLNFVDGKPLPFARDDYEKRKVSAWAAAFRLVDAA